MGAMAVHLIARTHDTRRELAMIKLVLKAPEHAHVIDVSHIRRRVDQSPDANSTELANEKERASRQRQRRPQRRGVRRSSDSKGREGLSQTQSKSSRIFHQKFRNAPR